MMSASYNLIGRSMSTKTEEPKYPPFLPRVNKMTEAYQLHIKPVIGPFAVQMEIYSAPIDFMIPTTTHPLKGEP